MMRKIALLYDNVLDVGGVESHIRSISRKSDAAQFSYIICSPVSERFTKQVEIDGVSIIPLKRRRPINPLTPFEVAKKLKKERVDIIHAHSPNAALWGRIAAWILRIPAVVTVHLPVDQYHGRRETVRARFGRRIYSAVDRWLNYCPGFTQRIIYVAQSIYEGQVAKGHSPSNLSTVITNGIDLNNYTQHNKSETRKGFGLQPSSTVIIFVGRLDEQKGVDILFDSLRILKSSEIEFKVWIIGDGVLRHDLEAVSRQYGLEDKVKFWGHQEDVPRFLKASDIFVLPSRYEGMSIALLNALAAGKPSVVTSVGDNDRLVIDGVNGLVVPPEDSLSLTNALGTLLSDRELRSTMSTAALKTAQYHSEEIMVKELERVYNECLDD
jgi:glycosyltransferase involved in cell wall biosynthesis